jgi:hypothetical protein
MATVQKVAVIVKNSKGQIKTYNYTGSDVTTEALLLPSGGDTTQLSANNAAIVDLISSVVGDTSQIVLYINGLQYPMVVYRALCLPTALGGRQCQQQPIPIAAGASVKFIQVT